MRNTLETRLGLFFALAMLAAIFIIEMVGGLEFFKGGYHLYALFTNVQELKRGDPVKMAGKQIGKVDGIDWADNKIKVTLKITDRKAIVRTDSKATIKFLGLLGQNFLSLSLGSAAAPKMDPGNELATMEQPDLSTLLAKLDSAAAGVDGLMRNFSGENFSNLLGPFTQFLKDNKDKLGAVIGNLQTISGQIAEGKGTVGKLINDDALYQTALTTVTNFNETATEVKGLVTQAKTSMNQITEGQGTLGKLTKDDTLYREATTMMTNLREVSEKINRGQGSVGKLVNDDSLYKNARLTMQKLDKATESLEDQGPLTVIGIVASHLF